MKVLNCDSYLFLLDLCRLYKFDGSNMHAASILSKKSQYPLDANFPVINQDDSALGTHKGYSLVFKYHLEKSSGV